MKKRILHLITGIELGGGAENMLLHLLPRMQDDLDNRVCVIRGKGEIGKKLEEKGIPVYYLDLKNFFDLGIVFRYRKVLIEFNPDAQVNYLIHADVFGRIFGKIFGIKKIIPYIRNIHRNKKILMFLDKITLPLSDFVLTNSETAMKHYIEKMGVQKENIKCIPNGINLARFKDLVVDREKKLKEIGINRGVLLIGAVARLEKQKDIPTLISAFENIHKDYPKAHLLIIGHGSQKNSIRNMIRDLGIEDNVTMLEKRTDILELISIMDIFVLPSLNEGMSNALLEAMALERIIIVSNIYENKELIEDNKNGFMFVARNHKDLAIKLKLVLKEKIETDTSKNIFLNKIKFNAKNKIVNKYTLDIIIKEFNRF